MSAYLLVWAILIIKSFVLNYTVFLYPLLANLFAWLADKYSKNQWNSKQGQ